MRRADSLKNYFMILTAMLAAIIIVFTVVPYTGYISYGGILEITTLHIFVVLGSCLIGVKGGVILGGVWGVTCMLRALTNPLWAPFVNPLVSVFPRIMVGLVAALVYKLCKKGLNDILSCIIAAISAAITNTFFVLIMYNLFAGTMTGYKEIYEVFKSVFNAIIGINFIVETGLAIIVVPIICKALQKVMKRQI